MGRPDDSRAGRIRFGTAKMFKVECVVNDEMLDMTVDIIQSAAHTGRAGDGKIFIYDVAEMIKIKTGIRSTTSE